MKSNTTDDVKTLYRLAMIAAYKGMTVAKGAAKSLGMPFDEVEVQAVADELALDREQAENELFEESKSRRKRLSLLMEQAAQNSDKEVATAGAIRPVLASFKALVVALGQRAAVEVPTLTAALFHFGIGSPVIRSSVIAVRNRTEPEEIAKTAAPLNWRLETIEDEFSPPDVRLTVVTDIPADDSVQFVVLGLNAALLQKIKAEPSDGKLVASDDVRVLWEGCVQAKLEKSVQISFKMPDDLEITDHDHQINVPLQQDAEGIWGVILKVEPKVN